MSKGLFVIIDPSLRDFRGHHYMLTDLASRSAEHAGMEVIWLVADPIETVPQRANVEIKPWFSMSMYDAYRQAPKKQLRPSLFDRVRMRFLGAPTAAKATHDPADSLESELRRAFGAFRSEDRHVRFFSHTADGAIYRAMGRLAAEIAELGNASIHLCTPYDPVGVMPNRGPERDIAPAIDQLLGAGVVGNQVFLHAENELLATHLASLWGVPVSPLEIPVDLQNDNAKPPVGAAFRKQRGLSEEAFVIASLGPARLEKGFDLLPDIIAAWRSRDAHEGRPEVKFVLHAAPQIIGRHPQIAKAIDRIKYENDGAVLLLEDTLSEEEYGAVLAGADALILPYDPQAYGVRSSGPVAEALANGKIMIARANAYPGRRIPPGAGEVAETPAQFADAIAMITAAPDAYRHAARQAAIRYREENAIDDYLPKILRAEKAMQ